MIINQYHQSVSSKPASSYSYTYLWWVMNTIIYAYLAFLAYLTHTYAEGHLKQWLNDNEENNRSNCGHNCCTFSTLTNTNIKTMREYWVHDHGLGRLAIIWVDGVALRVDINYLLKITPLGGWTGGLSSGKWCIPSKCSFLWVGIIDQLQAIT